LQNTLSRANKKTVMLIGFMGIHSEISEIFAHRNLEHKMDSEQRAVNRKSSEEVNKSRK
jgi:hypothetical protein